MVQKYYRPTVHRAIFEHLHRSNSENPGIIVCAFCRLPHNSATATHPATASGTGGCTLGGRTPVLNYSRWSPQSHRGWEENTWCEREQFGDAGPFYAERSRYASPDWVSASADQTGCQLRLTKLDASFGMDHQTELQLRASFRGYRRCYTSAPGPPKQYPGNGLDAAHPW